MCLVDYSVCPMQHAHPRAAHRLASDWESGTGLTHTGSLTCSCCSVQRPASEHLAAHFWLQSDVCPPFYTGVNSARRDGFYFYHMSCQSTLLQAAKMPNIDSLICFSINVPKKLLFHFIRRLSGRTPALHDHQLDVFPCFRQN